jgi:hypothetical protein
MAAGLIDRLFLAHPRSAGQGYFEHMRFAWSFAATMAVGTVAALLHGLFPFVCQTAAGDRVRALYARLSGRGPGHASKAASLRALRTEKNSFRCSPAF